ncbi:MAG: 23S rRNA (guanosine2251-2'-O)-methyltransferase [Rhodothermales bacterium]|jgi:23S rRNA (guanosine2251-2'-O)-methyltransferase
MRVETQDRAPSRPRHAIVLILDRLRSAYNVGNLFRLAEVAGLEGVYTCGYTATPPHPKLAKSARGCDELVPCTHFANSADAVSAAQAKGRMVIAIETVAGAPDIWDLPLQMPLALVLGNEALGIDPDALEACDAVARLPVFGSKNSLNVANCASAVVYDIVRRLG